MNPRLMEDSKRTMTAIVLEKVRDAILAGELVAGSRLDQARLADRYNVSLVPVREALKILEAEGFVQIIPRRGAFVTEISIRDMEDLYFSRMVLEGEAAYHAAEKLTDGDIQLLEELYRKMGEALERHDYATFLNCNREFHFVMYQATGSIYLMDMIRNLWELAQRYRYRYVFLRDRGPAIQSEHRMMVEACRQRDRDRLREIVIKHMRETLINVKRYLPVSPPSGL